MSCGAGHRHGLDPVLLWLWYRPAAVVLIRPLAWELTYASPAAIKAKKKAKKSPNKKKKINLFHSFIKWQECVSFCFVLRRTHYCGFFKS